ncbi:MAG: DNA polymerase III subunit delta [Bacteroidales bacterium]|nr:DNA polymerase III subunit delta [Bacteroidales bacterium]
MQFSEVIGQEKIKKKLISAVTNGRIPHAQLYFGPEGCGSLPMAIAYAQYISCTNRQENDSCGTCPSCQKIKKLIHPDLHFSFPFNATKKVNKALDKITSDEFVGQWREKVLFNAYFNEKDWYAHIGIENKQGIIGKSESESITRKLNMKSFESEYKFMIIWLPEHMNTKSANSLLKLIEEPPAKTVFLLVSESPNLILPTISSRTQPIKLNPIENDAVKEAVSKIVQLEGEALDRLVRLASGNYIRALEIMDNSEKNAFFLEKFKLMMRLAWARDIQSMMEWVDEMAGLGREQLKDYFSYALHMLRENFILNTKNSQVAYLTNSEEQFSSKFHPFINGRNVIPIKQELNNASSDIARNGYAKIVLLDSLLRISRLIRR